MDDNRKLLVAALVVIFGGNATGIANLYIPSRHDSFSGLNAAELRADMVTLIDVKTRENARDINDIRLRLAVSDSQIKECLRHIERGHK